MQVDSKKAVAAMHIHMNQGCVLSCKSIQISGCILSCRRTADLHNTCHRASDVCDLAGNDVPNRTRKHKYVSVVPALWPMTVAQGVVARSLGLDNTDKHHVPANATT